ncbi:MAG: Hsp70 family protein [Chloroflexi bacterium]|nr:Hsp70 family protein [Chloroflexota bacterium]
MGRPVRFARDPQHDRLAQARLLQAAFRAGYEKVYFQYEPIAAAYSYETTIDKPENVLIFDFGGGTLDITIMRLGEPGKRQVLATGGIPVAGDVFDQKLVRAKLPKHFGEGSQYGDRRKSADHAAVDLRRLFRLAKAAGTAKLRKSAHPGGHCSHRPPPLPDRNVAGARFQQLWPQDV